MLYKTVFILSVWVHNAQKSPLLLVMIYVPDTFTVSLQRELLQVEISLKI